MTTSGSYSHGNPEGEDEPGAHAGRAQTDSEKLGYDAARLPAHYLKHKIEPVFFVVENNLGFLEANVVKYLLRYKDKNGIEDLRKASRYLEMLIKRESGEKEWNK